MKKSASYYIGYMFIFIIVIFLLFAGYKISEWKLKNIWGIENPTFWQVIDSQTYKK